MMLVRETKGPIVRNLERHEFRVKTRCVRSLINKLYSAQIWPVVPYAARSKVHGLKQLEHCTEFYIAQFCWLKRKIIQGRLWLERNLFPASVKNISRHLIKAE